VRQKFCKQTKLGFPEQSSNTFHRSPHTSYYTSSNHTWIHVHEVPIPSTPEHYSRRKPWEIMLDLGVIQLSCQSPSSTWKWGLTLGNWDVDWMELVHFVNPDVMAYTWHWTRLVSRGSLLNIGLGFRLFVYLVQTEYSFYILFLYLNENQHWRKDFSKIKKGESKNPIFWSWGPPTYLKSCEAYSQRAYGQLGHGGFVYRNYDLKSYFIFSDKHS